MKTIFALLIATIYTIAFIININILVCLITAHCFVNYAFKHYQYLEQPYPNYSVAFDSVFNIEAGFELAEPETEPVIAIEYGKMSYHEI